MGTSSCGDGLRCDESTLKCTDERADAGAPDGRAPTCPPYVLPTSCDAKYLEDRNNCCIAGRSCGDGGVCSSGRCQPIRIVADASTDARAIKVSGNYVLWGTGGHKLIRRCAKDGSGDVKLPGGEQYFAPTLDVEPQGVYVYWIEYNGPHLNATRIDGQGTRRTVAHAPVPDGGAVFGRLAVDDRNAYWAMANPASVWHAPLGGDDVAASPLAIAADAGVSAREGAANPYGVAVDRTHVYWSDQGNGTIKRRALDRLDEDLLADVLAHEEGPKDIALDEENIYWLTGNGLVRWCAKNACAPRTLAEDQKGAEFVIVDDRYVYWTTYVENGAVSRVQKPGGSTAIERLATNQKKPWGIAQDCDTIYWTNHNDSIGQPDGGFDIGEVMKVVK